MRRVEQQVIEQSHPHYRAIDAMAFASKNLWNLANYETRQAFIFQNRYLASAALYPTVKHTDAYRALPAKVANQVLLQLDQAWRSFFEANEAYQADPSQFTGRPKLPKYKHKTEGRNLLVFELGCIWKAELRHREIAVSHLGVLGETKQQPASARQVRLVPKADHYVFEVVYEAEEQRAAGLDPELFAALDPGVNVLAALTSNKAGFVPRLVSGKPVKAINQLYNKQREHLQKQLARGKEPRYTSHRLDRITTKRNRRVLLYLHAASRRIIERHGGGRHRRAGPGQEPVLEDRRGTGKEAQPGIRADSPCAVVGTAHLQSRGQRHPRAGHGGELHQQSQLSGSGPLARL